MLRSKRQRRQQHHGGAAMTNPSTSSRPLDDDRKQKKVLCCVHLPNDSSINFVLYGNQFGEDLWKKVHDTLCVPELHFFGLKCSKRRKRKGKPAKLTWVRKDAKLAVQLGSPEPLDGQTLPMGEISRERARGAWHFYLTIKYFVGEQFTSTWSRAACELLFYQLRHDISTGVCALPLRTLITTCGYIAHALCGDFHFDKHELTDYLRELELAPDSTEEFLKAVQQRHRQCRGMVTCAKAIDLVIATCQHSEGYGVEYQDAIFNNQPVQIGISSRGISVYTATMQLLHFQWSRISELGTNGRKFHIKAPLHSSNNPHGSDGTLAAHQSYGTSGLVGGPRARYGSGPAAAHTPQRKSRKMGLSFRSRLWSNASSSTRQRTQSNQFTTRGNHHSSHAQRLRSPSNASAFGPFHSSLSYDPNRLAHEQHSQKLVTGSPVSGPSPAQDVGVVEGTADGSGDALFKFVLASSAECKDLMQRAKRSHIFFHERANAANEVQATNISPASQQDQQYIGFHSDQRPNTNQAHHDKLGLSTTAEMAVNSTHAFNQHLLKSAGVTAEGMHLPKPGAVQGRTIASLRFRQHSTEFISAKKVNETRDFAVIIKDVPQAITNGAEGLVRGQVVAIYRAVDKDYVTVETEEKNMLRAPIRSVLPLESPTRLAIAVAAPFVVDDMHVTKDEVFVAEEKIASGYVIILGGRRVIAPFACVDDSFMQPPTEAWGSDAAVRSNYTWGLANQQNYLTVDEREEETLALSL